MRVSKYVSKIILVFQFGCQSGSASYLYITRSVSQKACQPLFLLRNGWQFETLDKIKISQQEKNTMEEKLWCYLSK